MLLTKASHIIGDKPDQFIVNLAVESPGRGTATAGINPGYRPEVLAFDLTPTELENFATRMQGAGTMHLSTSGGFGSWTLDMMFLSGTFNSTYLPNHGAGPTTMTPYVPQRGPGFTGYEIDRIAVAAMEPGPWPDTLWLDVLVYGEPVPIPEPSTIILAIGTLTTGIRGSRNTILRCKK
jgi:hypothetical protein